MSGLKKDTIYFIFHFILLFIPLMSSQPLASPPPYSYHYQPSAPSNEQGYLLPRQPLLIAHGNTRYIIKKRNADIRHFPVNASFFLLGL